MGRRAGPAIFNRPDSQRTHAFYDKHGGKTIIYAKFVPIIRTFAPFVAGVGKMRYSRFLSFDIFGGAGWVFSMTILGIIFVSLLPVITHAVRAGLQRKAVAGR